MKIKLNFDLNGHKKGSVLKIKSKDCVPIDIYWRKRLKESESDNCIEVIKNISSTINKKIKSESSSTNNIIVEEKNINSEVMDDDSK